MFGGSGRADALIGAQESGSSRVVVAARSAIDAPVVEAHSNIEQKGVASGEVEIKDAGQVSPLEQHVVAKEIGVHRSSGELPVGRGQSNLVLKGQFTREQQALSIRYAAADHRHDLDSTIRGPADWLVVVGNRSQPGATAPGTPPRSYNVPP